MRSEKLKYDKGNIFYTVIFFLLSVIFCHYVSQISKIQEKVEMHKDKDRKLYSTEPKTVRSLCSSEHRTAAGWHLE